MHEMHEKGIKHEGVEMNVLVPTPTVARLNPHLFGAGKERVTLGMATSPRALGLDHGPASGKSAPFCLLRRWWLH